VKAFYRLLNYEFGELLRGVLILCGGLIAASWIFVRIELKDYSSYTVHERFEDIYSSSGMPIVFLVFMLALLALFVKSIYSAYWGSKSVYTLLTLPVKREVLYFSKLTAFGISVLLLLSSQLTGFVLAYRYMADKVSSYSEGQFEMTNGLFLAFIRSDFMRLLWPYGFLNILSTASILIVLITGVYYVVLCDRSKRRLSITLFIACFFILFLMIGARLDPVYTYDPAKIVTGCAVLLAISVVFIWHSIYLLKKGTVA